MQSMDYGIIIDVIDNARRNRRIQIGDGRKPGDKVNRRPYSAHVCDLSPGSGDRHAQIRSVVKEANHAMGQAKATMEDINFASDSHLELCNGLSSDRHFFLLKEPGYKSQQGRAHVLVSSEALKDDSCVTFRCVPMSFNTT